MLIYACIALGIIVTALCYYILLKKQPEGTVRMGVTVLGFAGIVLAAVFSYQLMQLG